MKWPIVSLANALQSAKVFIDGDWIESKDQDENGDVRLIQLADIGDGCYIDKSSRFLTSSKARELHCTFLQAGDVLVARMPDPLGRACIFPGDTKRSVTVVDVCIIRPDPDIHDANWLMYILNAPAIRNQIASFATGTTRSRISRGNLGKIKIPLPPLKEQQRIVEVLDRAEALRAKRLASLAQLDSLAQAIFLGLFGDPTTNPKGWTKRLFGEVCESRLGKMLDQKQQTGKHLRPYLRNANVQWFSFDLKEVFEMDFNQAAREEFRLKDGDLLICEGGEPGRAAIWREQIAECFYQKALHCARPYKALANSEYLVWLLWFLSKRGGLSDHVTSATIAHLTGEKLKAMHITLPPIDIQDEFARRIEAVEKLKTSQRASLAELDALFASLQHRAFRGEL